VKICIRSYVIYSLYEILLRYQIKEDEMDGPCMTHGIVEMHTSLLSKYLTARDHLADLGVDVKIIIKFTVK
jgi:alpha-D-ribose 1-methylphosphonate 5-triphosphate diphosphatase PhnM